MQFHLPFLAATSCPRRGKLSKIPTSSRLGWSSVRGRAKASAARGKGSLLTALCANPTVVERRGNIDGVSGVKFVCPLWRPVLGAALAAFAMFAICALPTQPAEAQGGPPVSLIRDTEGERVLRAYLDPIL